MRYFKQLYKLYQKSTGEKTRKAETFMYPNNISNTSAWFEHNMNKNYFRTPRVLKKKKTLYSGVSRGILSENVTLLEIQIPSV